MEITFLIGNGFDIMHGMKTTYANFYTYVEANFSDEKIENNFFYKKIKGDILNWSDFEYSMGLCTFDSDIDEGIFMESLEEFREDLEEYLLVENNNSEIPRIEETLFSFIEEMKDGDIETLEKMFESDIDSFVKVNFINFNYTDLLDRAVNSMDWYEVESQMSSQIKRSSIMNVSIGDLYHIHEKIHKGTFLGLNDEAQLDASKFTNESKEVLIKPKLINEYNPYRIEEIQNMILRSNLTIIFGMSLGETDKIWWQYILSSLSMNSSKRLIIHLFDPQEKVTQRNPSKYLKVSREIKKLILRHVKENQYPSIDRQIMTILNSKYMFKSAEKVNTKDNGFSYSARKSH